MKPRHSPLVEWDGRKEHQLDSLHTNIDSKMQVCRLANMTFFLLFFPFFCNPLLKY